MVASSANVVPILVDCTPQGAYRDLMRTYGVTGFPTLLFVGSDGQSLGKSRRDAASLVQLMDQLGQQSGGGAGAASRKWPGLVILLAVLIAVPCVLVVVYKKFLAGRMEEEES